MTAQGGEPYPVERSEGEMSAADGTVLHFRRSTPDRALGLAVVVHGLTEHSGRYGKVGGDLGAAGFALHAFDLRGHGLSGGPRGDVDRYETHVDDVALFCDTVRAQNASLPLFVVGHSLGGLLAAHYAAGASRPPDGLVLSSTPAVIGSRTPPLVMVAARAMAFVNPRIRVGPRLEPEFLSHDAAAMKELEADPLILKKVTVRMVSELDRARRELPPRASRIRMPVLILHGTADRIADVRSVDVLLESLASANKSKFLFEGLRHELFQEAPQGRAEVLERLTGWLAGRLAETPTENGEPP